MGAIHLLDRHTAELIAAGEVVERPASVVKELLENAMDAKASSVTVEIKNGGVTLIRVTDNGCGMEKEDVPTAFLRHATSKISQAEDLESIESYGFRGEALASIAAVSRVELVTRRKGEVAGTRCLIEGGGKPELSDAGCAVGTSIAVKDLFYNTPARMKFLKKDSTEGAAVSAVVERLAISRPKVAVKFIRESVLKFQTPGDGNLLSAIYAVYGSQFASSLVEVDYFDEPGRVTVKGFVSKPHEARNSRSMQNFFVNSRWIRSAMCSSALEQAYRNQMMTGKFPACVLLLEMHPSLVDVNVHPAKTEVKFAQEKELFSALYYAVKSALSESQLTPEVKLEEKKTLPSSYRPAHWQQNTGEQTSFSSGSSVRTYPEREKEKPSKEFWDALYRPLQKQKKTETEENEGKTVLRNREGFGYGSQSGELSPALQKIKEEFFSKTKPALENEKNGDGKPEEKPREKELSEAEEAKPENPLSSARLVGELFDTYLILQAGDNAYFVDKHAAHERLLFEELRNANGNPDRQVLLTPLVLSLSVQEHELCLQQLSALQTLGMVAEDFGDNTVLLREIPVMLSLEDAKEVFIELLQKLASGNPELTPEKMDDLYHSIACRAAIKAHDRNVPLELKALVKMLSEQEVDYCPHGRPVKLVMTRRELEKQFKRVL